MMRIRMRLPHHSQFIFPRIKLTKFRIKHYEKHGRGNMVIEEKAKLKKQERHKELRKEQL